MVGERRAEAPGGGLQPTGKRELETSKSGVFVGWVTCSGRMVRHPSKGDVWKTGAKKSGRQMEGPWNPNRTRSQNIQEGLWASRDLRAPRSI